MEQFISCSACSVNMMSMARASLGLGLYLQQQCVHWQLREGGMLCAGVGVCQILCRIMSCESMQPLPTVLHGQVTVCKRPPQRN